MRDCASLFKNVQAREIMTSCVACLRQDVSVIQAIDLLLKFGLNSAPVVDDGGRLVGVISEKDVMDALDSDLSSSTLVTDLMTTRVIQYEPEASAQLIFDFLCRVQLRRVIVVEAGKPIGVISRGNLLRWIKNHLRIEESVCVHSDSKLQLFQTAESLLTRTIQLRDEIVAFPDDVTHPLICGVSSIEILLGDLLMWAGCSKPKQGGEKLAECL
jgi:CBS domain-containing protein